MELGEGKRLGSLVLASCTSSPDHCHSPQSQSVGAFCAVSTPCSAEERKRMYLDLTALTSTRNPFHTAYRIARRASQIFLSARSLTLNGPCPAQHEHVHAPARLSTP